MIPTAAGIANEIALSVVVAGVLASIRLIVWLLGLMVALRGSEAKDRAIVLRAYLQHHGLQRTAGLGSARGSRNRRGEPPRKV